MSWLEGNYKQARDGDGDYKAMMIWAKNHPEKNPQTLEVVEKEWSRFIINLHFDRCRFCILSIPTIYIRSKLISIGVAIACAGAIVIVTIM